MDNETKSTKNRCSPVEMRKNLVIVDALKNAGIDFVPIPATGETHKAELHAQLWKILADMEKEHA